MTEIDIHTFGRYANAGHASPFGAHVLDWQPNSDHPLLCLSPSAVTDGTAPNDEACPALAWRPKVWMSISVMVPVKKAYNYRATRPVGRSCAAPTCLMSQARMSVRPGQPIF